MNADRLLALYARIADAPDAVARLRRFILDLAVRGKLVPQDPADEPASELLKRIAKEKARLVKEPIAADKGAQSSGTSRFPFEVPENWRWTPLSEMGRLSGGMTPSMSRSEYWGEDVIWLTPKDIKSNDLSDSEKKISYLGMSETRLELFPAGCIFIVARSGILKRTLPVAINRVPAAANQDMKVLVPYIPRMERYLQIMLRGMENFILRELVKTGTTVQSLKYADFERQHFPLPPLAEQHRIVAKVDELMGLCNRLEEARTRREAHRERLTSASLSRLTAPATDAETFQSHARFALEALPALTSRPDQIKALRQTIVNLAVRGKLVESDAADEPAVELLKKTGVEGGTASPTGRRQPPESPFDLPRHWAWTELRELVSHSDAGWSPRTENHERQGDAWGVLKVSAVSWERFDASANKQLLPGTKPRLQAQVRKGDFLISRANTSELVAKAVIVEEDPVHLMMSDKIVRLHIVKGCSRHFVLMVNNAADFARAYYAANATGVSPSMKNVSRDVILKLPIPLPPLAEQHRIVAKVDQLMALCDQLEAALTTADTTRRRLLEALLHEALAPAADGLAAAQ